MASVGHDVGCVRGGNSGLLNAQEFVNSVRLGTQCAACYCLNLQLPISRRELIPSRDGWLFDAETAGGLGLGAEKLDDFFCSHASSIAATITPEWVCA